MEHARTHTHTNIIRNTEYEIRNSYHDKEEGGGGGGGEDINIIQLLRVARVSRGN